MTLSSGTAFQVPFLLLTWVSLRRSAKIMEAREDLQMRFNASAEFFRTVPRKLDAARSKSCNMKEET